MAYIEYTTTKFVKPQPIGENEYRQFKRELDKNPDYEIIPEGESFTEHFEGDFKWIGIGLGGGFLLMMIGCELLDGSNWLALFMMPGSLLFLGGIGKIFRLFLEAPSFAKFKRQKRNHFENMKTAIQQTDTYDDFVNAFYIK